MKRFCLLSLLLLHAVVANADPQIAAVQELLKSQGLYDREISGEDDNETAAAITRFQVRRGLEVTGELNEETLQALGLNPSRPARGNADQRSQPRTEPWRALREQDREFLKQLTSSSQSTQSGQQVGDAAPMRSDPGFRCRFCGGRNQPRCRSGTSILCTRGGLL